MYRECLSALWTLDWILLGVSASLGAFIILYALFQSYRAGRRRRALTNIKKNVHDLAVSGQGPSDETCPIVNTETMQQFLDVEMNREAVLFNESEREFIKKCLGASDKIPLLRGIAKKAKDKWRRIEAILSLG